MQTVSRSCSFSSPGLPAFADTRLDEIDELRLVGDYEPAIELRALAELEATTPATALLNQLGELRLEDGEIDARRAARAPPARSTAGR